MCRERCYLHDVYRFLHTLGTKHYLLAARRRGKGQRDGEGASEYWVRVTGRQGAGLADGGTSLLGCVKSAWMTGGRGAGGRWGRGEGGWGRGGVVGLGGVGRVVVVRNEKRA